MTDDRIAHRPATPDLPELPTQVALAGTVHQAEVGGNVCFNTVVGIATIHGRP